MNQTILRLLPLTAEAFSPYGDVLEVSERNRMIPINYGLTERHHDLAQVDVDDQDGRAIVSIFRSQSIQLPFTIKVMERHPLGSQTFMPLTGNPWAIVVAPAGEFDPAELRGFFARADQGVNYHKGTWHHYCMGLNARNDFLVVDRGGEGHNCDEVTLPENLNLTINH